MRVLALATSYSVPSGSVRLVPSILGAVVPEGRATSVPWDANEKFQPPSVISTL
jgi:hypothetical protein